MLNKYFSKIIFATFNMPAVTSVFEYARSVLSKAVNFSEGNRKSFSSRLKLLPSRLTRTYWEYASIDVNKFYTILIFVSFD